MESEIKIFFFNIVVLSDNCFCEILMWLSAKLNCMNYKFIRTILTMIYLTKNVFEKLLY